MNGKLGPYLTESSAKDNRQEVTMVNGDGLTFKELTSLCPDNGDGLTLMGLDNDSPNTFDTSFYANLRNRRGIL
ncbi:hypothetical protein RHMOL_Rhmol07G0217700 [Rhododendron molle]|uniref:Uncharacterized protein n=1 Tax=Rhododendron molle TaxID=49168 RepID=A0ACC0N4Y2_RHOML|nr:hypothetical protein RHMOL_Rhmol07G0217700 [Rhododendron molle]